MTHHAIAGLASGHLLAGTRIRESVPTYRGMGHAW